MADVAPGWLVSLLAAYLVIWSAFGIAFIIGVVFAVVKIKRGVSRASAQIKATTEPVVSTVRGISDRVERIGKAAETTMTGVARKVEAASDTFAKPAAAVAAFVNGIRKGVSAGRAKRSG